MPHACEHGLRPSLVIYHQTCEATAEKFVAAAAAQTASCSTSNRAHVVILLRLLQAEWRSSRIVPPDTGLAGPLRDRNLHRFACESELGQKARA